ncbi:hypothetical protein V9T40_001707 [Parthenolecanium corni]|uniref:Uncharacterized protein n=1 Tax=Parthenolecanium corni TaxID=536013 RepID=A0AAN9TH26_9HEMI
MLLTLEIPGFTRLLKGPGSVIYDTTRVTSKDPVASYDTSLVNRGDSFRRRHNRSNSVFPSSTGSLVDEQQQEVLEQICNEQVTHSPDNTTCTYNVSVTGTTGVGKTSLISQFMTSECINPYDRDRGKLFNFIIQRDYSVQNIVASDFPTTLLS